VEKSLAAESTVVNEIGCFKTVVNSISNTKLCQETDVLTDDEAGICYHYE
jgi:hypothetical protein